MRRPSQSERAIVALECKLSYCSVVILMNASKWAHQTPCPALLSFDG
jgi:hypothetical protein